MKREVKKAMMRLLVPALSLLPIAAFGQQTIEQAFQDFVKNPSVKITESRNRQADPATGELLERSYLVDFSMEHGEKQIDKLLRAFDQDRDASYNEFTRTGAGQGVQPIVIGKEIWIGSDPQDNYIVMSFADKMKQDDKRPQFRTVYALEWREEKDGRTWGKLVTCYGPIPKKERKARRIKSDWSMNNNGGFSSDDLIASLTRLDSLITNDESVKQSLVSLDSLFTNSDMLSDLGSLFSGKAKDKNSTAHWLDSFKKLCRSQMKYAKQGKSLTYFPSEILEQCKRGRDLLTDEECQLCQKELDRIIAVTKDEFDRDLLEQAKKQLTR